MNNLITNPKQFIRLVCLYVGFFFFTIVIIIFSMTPGAISTEQSGMLVTILEKILLTFGVTGDELLLAGLSGFVRKVVGHFLLFIVDGLFLYLALLFTPKFQTKVTLIYFLFFISLALLSEGLQLITADRAGMLEDVLIDIFGAFTSWALLHLLIFKPLNARKGENQLQ